MLFKNIFLQHCGSSPTAGPDSHGWGFNSESPLSGVSVDWDGQGVPGSLLPTLWCEWMEEPSNDHDQLRQCRGSMASSPWKADVYSLWDGPNTHKAKHDPGTTMNKKLERTLTQLPKCSLPLEQLIFFLIFWHSSRKYLAQYLPSKNFNILYIVWRHTKYIHTS